MKDTIDSIRQDSDSHASGPDYVGNGYPSAPRHVRVLLCEIDRLRSELYARMAISPEDAAEAAGALGAEWDFVPFAVRERINAEFYAHAEKARKR